MTTKLIANWQKKNYQLSQLIVDSLEGLDVWETVLALGKIRNMQKTTAETVANTE
ncbi:hypothetical protein [Streptococcus suis]